VNERRVPWWRRPENWAGLLMSIAFHAACAALLRATWPPTSGAAAAPAVARYAYWIEEAPGPGPDAWDHDPRALRSPSLFALPTTAGFSPARNRLVQPLPLLRVPGENNVLLERMPAQPDLRRLHSRTRSDVENIYRSRWLALDGGEEPYAIPPGESSAALVEWADGAPEIVAGLPLALNPPPAPGERAWEASATLLFSEAGEVVSVFLVKSTADRERNDAIVRALRGLRAVPGREGRYGVNLYYYPAPVAERAGAGAVTP
jgi:hypothetical protein